MESKNDDRVLSRDKLTRTQLSNKGGLVTRVEFVVVDARTVRSDVKLGHYFHRLGAGPSDIELDCLDSALSVRVVFLRTTA